MFSRIEHFFRRLEIYTSITPTMAMSDIIVEIMIEVLRILGIATKEVKRGRFSELIGGVYLRFSLTCCSERYFKKLTGKREIEDSLERLDKLTLEEARMASAEQLKMTHSVDGKVMGVDDRVKGVSGQVQGVRGDVQDVRVDVQDVRVDVQDVRVDVRDIGNIVQAVDDKLDQASRSFSLNPDSHSARSDSFTGNQLRDNLLRWLSPPDPSQNHNIASKAHHNGTTQWFFQGSIFNNWKSTGSFLWVHGKRALLLAFAI